MSGLSFLSSYYGNNSDSDRSESENENIEGVNEAKRARLPAPNIKNIQVVLSEKHLDNPELHGGRKRAFPHVRGNWATSVLVRVPKGEDLTKIQKKLKTLVSKVDQSVKELEDLHISVSKTFILSYHQIASFSSSLSENLKNTYRFDVTFDGVEVYANEDKSTTFIALKVDKQSHTDLLNVTQIIDKTLEEFQLPLFYEDPSFHTSILWVSGNKKQLLTSILKDLDEIVHNELEDCVLSLNVNQIICKSGNKQFQYMLK